MNRHHAAAGLVLVLFGNKRPLLLSFIVKVGKTMQISK